MRKYIAEGVGTMLLTLIACGIAVTSGVDLVATSLAFGLVIVAAAYSIGNVSGCHINPAVSIALLVAGKMTVKECIFYVISQIIGAFVGSLLLGLILGNFSTLGANGLVGDTTVWIALLVEVILTFIFTATPQATSVNNIVPTPSAIYFLILHLLNLIIYQINNIS